MSHQGFGPGQPPHHRPRLRDHAQAGGTVVMATHDLDFAEQVADDISMMFDGEIACMEPPTDFFADNVFYRA